MNASPGVYVAVVGPSGAGKDAVISAAQGGLVTEPPILFPRRYITRPAGPGEHHIPLTEAEFAEREVTGGFAVTWDAHGLRYGIGVDVARDIEAGAIAVVNSSRAALGNIVAVFPDVRVVNVTVDVAERRRRLAARGREPAAAIAERLARPDPAPEYASDLEIVNDGTLTEAGGSLRAFLQDLNGAGGRPMT